jgi:hypothetical protein
MHCVFKTLPEPLLDRMYAAFDDNLDGYIDSREFICGLSLFCRGDQVQKLACMRLVVVVALASADAIDLLAALVVWFKIFDVDGDGFLSKAELLAMASSLWKVQALKSMPSNHIVDISGAVIAWHAPTLTHSSRVRVRVRVLQRYSGHGWRTRRYGSEQLGSNELDGFA